MHGIVRWTRTPAVAALALAAACSTTDTPTPLAPSQPSLSSLSGSGTFQFAPLSALTGDAACLDVGAITNDPTGQPLQLPAGFTQTIIGRQSDLATQNSEVNFDMMTLNETGPQAGRYLYRTHEVRPFAGLSVIDLWTGTSSLLAERHDWESFDGLVWTPWGTILMAEERIVQSLPDPDYPNIQRGLVYEYFPGTGKVVARPAIGARSHEGLRFDAQGNLYGISESRGIAQAGQSGQSGAIFKFVPDRRGDLSSGKLYALRVLSGRTGEAVWELLDLDPITFDSDAAAQAVGATGWDRPEDVEIGRSTGNSRGGNGVMYVAVTESSDQAVDNGLVLKIELHGDRAFVSNYVQPGVNVSPEVADAFGSDAGTGFDDPDNLALAPNGDLYITEDDSPSDIWVARGSGPVAGQVDLFARLLDCSAETTGIYFARNGKTLWVNSQHAGLNGGNDLTIAITANRGNQ
jgi:uncharacterized protein